MKKILIVGGVAGGATAAARLRRLSEEDEIILFERDEYISFANCGLPYYIGNVITDRQKLLVQTVEGMSKRFNLDIRNFSEVIGIDPVAKTVEVKNHQTNQVYTETFDKLILSPGAKPIAPPIPGLAEAENILTLRNIPDTDKIKAIVDTGKVGRAVVIGGGCVGIDVVLNALNGFKDVPQVVGQSLRIAAHTGLASASTAARNLSGSPLGVSTSTGTPSSLRSSTRIALMSNSVVSGVGSMRRSRSLLSVS